MLKRIFALMCSILCLQAGALSVRAETTYYTVKNSSFLEGEGGWNLRKASISSDKAYSGPSSLCIQMTDTSDNGNMAQQKIAVRPMTTLRFSAYMYAEVAEQVNYRGPAIKLEPYYLDANGTETALENGGLSTFFPCNTNGAWEKISYDFVVPPKCNYVNVLLRLYCAKGTVYYDDVTIEELSVNRISLDTDETFYYTDFETANASVTVNDVVFPHLSGKVKYTIKNASGVTQGTPKTLGLSETYSFPVSTLKNIGEAYTITAELIQNNQTIETHSETIYRYDRPSKLGKNNLYQKDGKDFYPRIGYHVTEEQYARVGELGINVVQVTFGSWEGQTEIDRVLKELKDNNLMALVTLYYRMVPAGYDEEGILRAKNIVTRTTQSQYSDAVFGYAIMDEPYLFYNPDPWLATAYKTVRDINKDLPVHVVDNFYLSLPRTARFTDILAVDPYPGTTEASTAIYREYVADRVRAAFDAVKGRRGVSNVLQAFEYRTFNPSAKELIEMEYAGLREGATACAYYAFDSAFLLNALANKDANYAELVHFKTEEIPKLYDFFNRNTDFDGTMETAGKWICSEGASFSDKTVHKGEKSLRLVGSGSCYQFSSAEGFSKTYKIKAHVKTGNGYKTGDAKLKIYDGVKTHALLRSEQLSDAEVWTKIELDGLVFSTGSFTVEILNEGTGEIFIDEISVSPTENIVPNFSFEESIVNVDGGAASDAASHSGCKSYCMQTASSRYMNMRKIPCSPNTEYILSYYHMSADTYHNLYVYERDASYNKLHNDTSIAVTRLTNTNEEDRIQSIGNVWRSDSFRFTTGPDAHFIHLQFGYRSGDHTAYIDDVSVVQNVAETAVRKDGKIIYGLPNGEYILTVEHVVQVNTDTNCSYVIGLYACDVESGAEELIDVKFKKDITCSKGINQLSDVLRVKVNRSTKVKYKLKSLVWDENLKPISEVTSIESE